MRSDVEVAQAIEQHADTVRRLCMVYLKNDADAEDIFQNVFLKYALYSAAFESPEHEAAWIVRVTINACKDLLRNVFRRRTVSLDQVAGLPEVSDPAHREVLEAVLSLPEKYRVAIYLHYYEGYTAAEIAEFSGCAQSTVRSRLARARKLLRKTIGGEFDAG